MMKIAVANQDGMVAQHFGHCTKYSLFKVNDGQISQETQIDNPGHQPGFLPGYLAEYGINCMMAGGMGLRAQQLFRDHDISTVVGASGPVREAVLAYLAGTLRIGQSSCHHPDEPHGECKE